MGNPKQGFFGPSESATTRSQFGVPQDGLVKIGFSPSAFLVLLVLCGALAPLPLLLGFKKLKGDMVAGGSNSLVVSAACHPFSRGALQQATTRASEQSPSSPVADTSASMIRRRAAVPDGDVNVEQGRPSTGGSEGYSLAPQDDTESYCSRDRLEKLVSGPLRWGVMPVPEHITWRDISRGEKEILHLGFIDEENCIGVPQNSQWYI